MYYIPLYISISLHRDVNGGEENFNSHILILFVSCVTYLWPVNETIFLNQSKLETFPRLNHLKSS